MMEEKIRRLLSWKQGREQPPVTLELNVTNKCNLSCRSCWQREHEVAEDKLDTDRMLGIVEEAIDLGVEEFRFPGAGEPLLKPGIFDAFRLVKEEGKEGQLITNGTVLSEGRAQELVEIGWDIVTISLDSPLAGKNNYLRGKNAYQRTISALDHLSGKKKQFSSELPHLRVNMVLSNRNYQDIKPMLDLISKYGVEELNIQPMTVWGASGRSLKLNEDQQDEFKKMAKQATKYAQRLGIETNLAEFYQTDLVEKAAENMKGALTTPDYDDRFLSLPCFEPFYNFVIFASSKTGPCSVSGGSNGDSILEKSLREIWYQGSITEVRRSLLSQQLLDFCQNCCSAINLENRKLRERLQRATSS